MCTRVMWHDQRWWDWSYMYRWLWLWESILQFKYWYLWILKKSWQYAMALGRSWFAIEADAWNGISWTTRVTASDSAEDLLYRCWWVWLSRHVNCWTIFMEVSVATTRSSWPSTTFCFDSILPWYWFLEPRLIFESRRLSATCPSPCPWMSLWTIIMLGTNSSAAQRVVFNQVMLCIPHCLSSLFRFRLAVFWELTPSHPGHRLEISHL